MCYLDPFIHQFKAAIIVLKYGQVITCKQLEYKYLLGPPPVNSYCMFDRNWKLKVTSDYTRLRLFADCRNDCKNNYTLREILPESQFLDLTGIIWNIYDRHHFSTTSVFQHKHFVRCKFWNWIVFRIYCFFFFFVFAIEKGEMSIKVYVD